MENHMLWTMSYTILACMHKMLMEHIKTTLQFFLLSAIYGKSLFYGQRATQYLHVCTKCLCISMYSTGIYVYKLISLWSVLRYNLHGMYSTDGPPLILAIEKRICFLISNLCAAWAVNFESGLIYSELPGLTPPPPRCTLIKNKIKHKKIQNGAVSKSYMTNGLHSGEIFAHFLIS